MNTTRKADRKDRKSRKASKGSKGRKSRKLSPALREWNRKVMEVFREKRKSNPNYKLRDAMKDAKKAN
jgi:hypothetical protein